jgi:hypothetical protein
MQNTKTTTPTTQPANWVNFPYFICNLTTGNASAFATYAEAEKALILLNAAADAYVIVDTVERCLEEI